MEGIFKKDRKKKDIIQAEVKFKKPFIKRKPVLAVRTRSFGGHQ